MKYFLHDTSAFSDEKITLLYMEYGFEGVGLFFTILERIALQEKPIQESVLKTQLNIRKKLEKILFFMYEINILSVRNGEVFNENLLNFSEKYQIKKEKTKKRVSEWREKQVDTKNVTRYERVSNARKVKESKVKESKVNIKENKEKIFVEQAQLNSENENVISFEPTKEISLHKRCINFFVEFYEADKKVKYSFTAKDAKAVQEIIKKIKGISEIENTTDPIIFAGFKKLVTSVKEYDTWVYQNLDLSTLNSKFNQLVEKIKNERKTNVNNNSRNHDFSWFEKRMQKYV